MSLYPSLEDMKVDHLAKAQIAQMAQQHQQQQQHSLAAGPQHMPVDASGALPYTLHPKPSNSVLYPSLNDYMGLDLTSHEIAQQMAAVQHSQVAVPQSGQVAVHATMGVGHGMIAPLSGSSVGLKRAEVTHGIREVVLCKDGNNKIGIKVKDVNKGVFIILVQKNSPAALAGLRFGDQILQVNNENVAGYDSDKMHNMLKKCSPTNIVMAIRDRPFERTITMHKSSNNHIGFIHKNGKIHSIVKDSSAARNGILTDHQLLEVNGQNVIGVKEKEISQIIQEGGNVITVTIMPSFVYDHIMKSVSSSLVREQMDHGIRDL